MRMFRKATLVALVLAAATGATVGLAYAIFETEFFERTVAATVTVTLMSAPAAADVSRDGRVDRSDVIIVAQNIGVGQIQDSRVEVDGVPGVNVGDLAFVGRYFGASVTRTHETHEVEAHNDFDPRFEPGDITISAGDTVVWQNVSEAFHTITFDDPNIESKPLLQIGESFTVTFSNPGTFDYQCEIHFPDMPGTVIVLQ